jgi:hypothetical protein
VRLRRGQPTGADRESGYHSVTGASPADDGFERTGKPGLIEDRRAVARPPTARVGSIEATVLGGCDSYVDGVAVGDGVGDGDGVAVGLPVGVAAGVDPPTITVATMPSSP